MNAEIILTLDIRRFQRQDIYTIVQKNQIYLLEIFKYVLKKEPTAKLILIGEGEDSLTLYNELTTDLKDDKTSFNVKGKAENNHTFDYTGILTLKDGKLVITFEKGSLTSNSTEGGSTSHNVGGLEENAKTVTLTKVEDKS